MAGKDLLSRLADAGEEAIGKFGKAPGGEQVVGAVHSMRERMDELQKRVRGIDDLERRIAELEQRLKAVEGPSRAPAKRKPASRSTKKNGEHEREGEGGARGRGLGRRQLVHRSDRRRQPRLGASAGRGRVARAARSRSARGSFPAALRRARSAAARPRRR